MKKQLLPFFLALFFSADPSLTLAQCDPSSPEIPNNGTDEDCDGLDDVFLFLPPFIYMTGGQDFELYFRNLILSRHPQHYSFTVTTPLGGFQTAEKWSYTPGPDEAGEFPITVHLNTLSGQGLASAASTVRITPASAPPDLAPRRLVLLGHSFFDQGYLPAYLYDLTHQPGNPPVSFHGKDASWSNPLARHEGYGGVTAQWFYENPNSPIRYGGQVNLRQYFDQVICPDCRPDWMVIHLDINDFCNNSAMTAATLPEIDAAIDANWNLYAGRIIDSIRAASPGTRIGICLSPMPNARESAFQLSFGGNPVLNNRWRWQKIISRLLFKNRERYGDRESENIFLVPENLDLDDFNEYTPLDAIHPFPIDNNIATPSGYREIAKSIYAWLRWCQFQGSPPVLSTYFFDADADGYGNSLTSLIAAAPPPGYVLVAGDCNDYNPAVHPDASEICGNAADEDCDGLIEPDAEAPLAICLATVSLPLGPSGDAVLTPVQVNNGSSDNCSPLTFSLSRSGFSCADLGAQTIVLTVRDVAGNTATCATAVQVDDHLPPTVTCPDVTLEPGPTGTHHVTLADLNPAATDNCGPVTWQTPGSLVLTCPMVNTSVPITLVALDNQGNAAPCEVQIYVSGNGDADGDGAADCQDACPDNPATAVLMTFFPDADQDGFGAGDSILACLPPPGAAANGLDCDDGNPAVYPGAAEVQNGLDDDCDGVADDGLVGTPAVGAAGRVIVAFPNPALNRVFVKWSGAFPAPATGAWVQESSGRVVRTFDGAALAPQGFEVNADGWPGGLYWIRVWFQDGRTGVCRFLKI